MNLENLCKHVISETRCVGAFIREEGLKFDTSKIEHKGFNDLVSYVDKEAEKQLVVALKKLLPEAGFITEEGTETTRQQTYNWIIDPLDGTTNFMHALPVFSISIALMQENEIVLGVIYEINRDETFSSWKNGGAFLNDKSISVSKAEKLADSLVATGFPYTNFGQAEKYLKILGGFMAKSHGVRRMGSAAVDLAYVACGRFESFFEFNLNAWDVAAGVLIVQEAGGKVTTFKEAGDPVFDREIVASNTAVHGEMLNVIKESNW
ncbi:inositol monophosphatase [Adhaeribacter sp. BT258]|uniref:Inositol-1-monophosphatase n=1 Tax=Adhaeribacter terrigena TaxID=2793070 RepID=A0ABS1C4X2_9BACT|nr:inositol monophosphatase family protein [Adhaeribacter terrigena]MBK0403683.1 inositol monophosphatase [Adhaeribacter terrigena]